MSSLMFSFNCVLQISILHLPWFAYHKFLAFMVNEPYVQLQLCIADKCSSFSNVCNYMQMSINAYDA